MKTKKGNINRHKSLKEIFKRKKSNYKYDKKAEIIDVDYADIEILSEEEAIEEINKREGNSKELLGDEDKLREFLKRLESKLKFVPKFGGKLSKATIMITCIRDYVKKEYPEMPLGTVIAILSSLIYFASPIDIMPDTIPFLGFLDDATVVFACWKMVESDIDEYVKWRENNE